MPLRPLRRKATKRTGRGKGGQGGGHRRVYHVCAPTPETLGVFCCDLVYELLVFYVVQMGMVVSRTCRSF